MSHIKIDYEMLASKLQHFDGTLENLIAIIERSSEEVYCGWTNEDAKQAALNLDYEIDIEESDLTAVMKSFSVAMTEERDQAWFKLESAVQDHYC